jgi:predicted Zn-dependent protease
MAKASEGAPPEFMSTHPASDSRIASLQAAEKLPLTLIRRLAATAFFVLAVVAVYKAMQSSGWL